MLECGFESRLGLKFSGFSMRHFLKHVVRVFFFSGTPVSPPPSSVNGFSQLDKFLYKYDLNCQN